MYGANAAAWIEIFNNVDVFIVVFVRVMGFFIILPVMAGQNLPLPARIGLSLSLALLAFTSNIIVLPEYQFTIIGFGFLLAQEFVLGLIIGFVVMIMFSMFHFVGQLVDFQIGFSMVSVADPFGQQQTPITGNLYYLLVSLFFIGTGALNLVIGAFFDSFAIVGIGEAVVLGNQPLMYYMLEIIISYFVLGLRIALPVIGTVVIIDIVLGILVKAVPQMNMFVVGLPIKVFIGLIVVYLTMPLLRTAFEWVMYDVVMYIYNIIVGTTVT